MADTEQKPGALPNPSLLMQTGLAYRSSAVLFAALELDVFTPLANGPRTAAEVAASPAMAETYLGGKRAQDTPTAPADAGDAAKEMLS